MHGIGNAKDAQTILEWILESPEGDCHPRRVESEDAPGGWKYIGHGTFRSVWRSPEGVCYKVDHPTCRRGQCEDEIRALRSAWEDRLPIEGVRLPRFEGFAIPCGPRVHPIVAIELIEGVTLWEYDGDDYDHFQALRRTVCHLWDMGDMHDENCMVEFSTGKLVPVDFG